LAVRFGAARARLLFAGFMVGALVAVGACGVLHPWALLGLAAAPLAITPARLVRTRSDPPSLVAALLAVGLRLS